MINYVLSYKRSYDTRGVRKVLRMNT